MIGFIKKFDWKQKAKNRAFWLLLIPAVLGVIQAVLLLFGVDWDFTDLNDKIKGVIIAAFALLNVLGLAMNPNSAGITDEGHNNDGGN